MGQGGINQVPPSRGGEAGLREDLEKEALVNRAARVPPVFVLVNLLHGLLARSVGHEDAILGEK